MQFTCLPCTKGLISSTIRLQTSTSEVQVGGSVIKSYLWLHREFKVSLHSTKFQWTKQTTTTKNSNKKTTDFKKKKPLSVVIPHL